MSALSVVIVFLRQPQLSNPLESRDDPYWEFGSFGCTGCHHRNLMNVNRLEELRDCRLAFAQGGPGEIKVVYISPPISEVRYHQRHGEVRWRPAEMPIAFKYAPILVSNELQSDVPSFLDLVLDVNRTTPCGKFVSKFRSRRQVLPTSLARELISVYSEFRTHSNCLARSYVDALPFNPPRIDRDRRTTYDQLVQRNLNR